MRYSINPNLPPSSSLSRVEPVCAAPLPLPQFVLPLYPPLSHPPPPLRSLSHVMGYKSQFVLYAYYLVVAWVLRTISPPLAQMIAHESQLSGSLRAAHQVRHAVHDVLAVCM